ncbi:MAG: DUF4166 domain-containing protein [Haloarculaceae archaeon]
MTGVYERALGEAADDLHPRVRERYAIGPGDGAVVGRGEMDIDSGTLALPALYAMPARDLLFPETGTDVPFTVTTVAYRQDGYEAMTTRREFDFGDTDRRFDSVTVWDHEHDRLLDFLGRGGLVASELRPRVEDGALVVGGGRQWARVASRYVPLPGPLAADVEVRDRYDDDGERYRVFGTVRNALAGRILRYRGTFTQTVGAMDPVPPEFKPTRLTSLPPA